MHIRCIYAVMIKFTFNMKPEKRDAFADACKAIGSHMGVELRKLVDGFIRKANNKSGGQR